MAMRGVARGVGRMLRQCQRRSLRMGVRYLSVKLPDGWEQVTRRNGEIVYYNAALRKTVRELPGSNAPLHASASLNQANLGEKPTSDVTETESTSKDLVVPIDFDKAVSVEGHDSQVVHIDLEPHQCLRAESGAMIYMTEGVNMETTTAGGMGQGFKRVMTGENFFVTRFTYEGSGKGKVALSTSFPSKIVHLRLEDFIGNSIICQKGAFLCGSDTINIEMEFAKKIGIGFFGGEGFVLQRLTGEGDALVRATGTLIERDLQPGEVLRISSGCLVAFEPTVQYDITMMKGVKNVMFGGEGLFVTTLTGPGKVYLQSLPFDRVIGEIAGRMPHSGRMGPFVPFFGGGGSSNENSEAAGDTPPEDVSGTEPSEEASDPEAASNWDASDDSIYGGASTNQASDANSDPWGSNGDDNNDEGGDDGGDDGDGEGGGGIFGFFSDLFTNDDD